MLFQQLKTLFFRNLILKKRAYISTLLEIIIPTLIIIIIGKNSEYVNETISENDINNKPLVAINNKEYFDDYFYKVVRLDFSFVFPPEFDKQKQDAFLENFKGAKPLNEFKLIDSNKNFTSDRVFENSQSVQDDITPPPEIISTSNNPTLNNNQNNNSTLSNNQNNNEVKSNKQNNNEVKSNDKNNNEVKSNDKNNDEVKSNNNNNGNGNNSKTSKTIPKNNNNKTDNEKETEQNSKVNNNSKTKQVKREIEIEDKEHVQSYEMKINVFNKEEEMKKAYRSNYNYDDYVNFYGIVFNSLTKYTLYIHHYGELHESLKDNTDNLKSAIVIQSLVNKGIIKALINSPNYQEIQINSKIMDKKGFNMEKKVNYSQSYIPFFMLFYFVPCVCTLLTNLVIEKESKIKESLIIIGLKKSTFWLSWAVTYGIIITISSVIVTIAMYYYNLFIFIHWSILIIVMIIYGLSCCGISFVLSTLIKKSKTANTIGIMIIVIFFAMYFVNMGLERKPIAQLICSFTVSPISFLSLFNYLLKLENQNLPVTFLNMLKNSTLRNYFLGMISTFVIYFFVALYLDNVLPQGNNFHRKWYFIFTDLFRCFKKNKNENHSSYNTYSKINNPYIQDDPQGLRKAVEVKNIRKNFKVKRENIEILKCIDFNAYYDEIFAILGHNGAGKTTLISIMTGILSASHGEVYYDNVPITGNETEICKSFGYCPQFDTFNNNLTVGEHVKLFAGIKNVTVDIDSTLKDIDLLEKKNNFPKELSGGQRRKLCITLALLGSPKFVFLDEPTTGLDPYSRKNIWELLSKKKKDRVMFVTTHYMDEADLLADRKMIISSGNITCLGTSLFLKNSFNMNYSLDIHCKNIKDSSIADDMIEYFCPGASQTKTISNTNINGHLEYNPNKTTTNISEEYIVTYLLPMKYSRKFKQIFENLNKLINDKKNSIMNFSLTAPTLEELFIKLENNKENNKDFQSISNTKAIDIDNDSTELINKLEPVFKKTNIVKASFMRQIYSIIKLRLTIFIRNKTFAILYTLLPLCIILICIYFENMIIKQVDDPVVYKALEIQPEIYEDVNWFIDTGTTGQPLDVLNRIGTKSKLSLKQINYQNDLSLASNKLSSDSNYIGGFGGSVNAQQGLEFTLYHNNTYSFALPIAINLLSNAILAQNNINEQISLSYKPWDDVVPATYDKNDENKLFDTTKEKTKVIMEPILILAIAISISISVSIYGPLTVKEREDGIIHQLFLNSTRRINYWIGVLISDSICILVPTLLIGIAGKYNDMNIYHPKVIGYTMIATPLWGISSLLHQYVVSYFFKKYEKVSSLFIIINPILSLFMGIYSLIVSLVASFAGLIEEEELKENNDESSYKQYYMYIILILYAPATIVLLYTKLSIFISMRKMKMGKDEISNFLLSKEVIDIRARKDISESEKSKILSNLFFEKKIPNLEDLFKAKEEKFIFLLICIAVLIILYALILYLMEKSKASIVKRNYNYTKEEREIKNKKLEDGPRDVYNEWWRVKQALFGNKFTNNIALKIYQLNKDFSVKSSDMRKKRLEERNKNKGNVNTDKKNKNNEKSAFQSMDDRITYDMKKKKHINRIVDDVTLGVNVGECLGLLGPNGAGKTTTISMITGLLSHTHGVIMYGNKDLCQTDMADLSLGYCAQYDSLWKLLTVKETIQFYLNICGYPNKDIPHYTKALIEACGIEIHTNKKISEISGGTKRKLSLIIAICSSPSYLILDEPSAGMDPFTRRYMWKLISELKKIRETATILTTHSTEEAEALCDRIAILIKGRLVCVDTPKSIKMNHSDNYILEVFTNYPEQFESEFIKKYNVFNLEPNEKYDLESSISYQKYSVKMKTENIANVFATMEYAKEHKLISQYNFGQYSLEQVFIKFVNNSK